VVIQPWLVTSSSRAAFSSRASFDVILVLVLIESAAWLLAGFGQAIFMGGPVPLLVPLLKSLLVIVLAVRAAGAGAGHREWAVLALLVVHALALPGFWLGLAAGFAPWVTPSVTLAGLLTGVALPLAVVCLCVGLLRRPRATAAPPPDVHAAPTSAGAPMSVLEGRPHGGSPPHDAGAPGVLETGPAVDGSAPTSHPGPSPEGAGGVR
jgi:hypothetical protein